MRAAPTPRRHLFVCANRREGSPLGPGCAERGEALYTALKDEVAKRGLVASVWITKTHCLGICPKHGATVARHGPDASSGAGAIATEVEPSDAASLLEETSPADTSVARADLTREIDALEQLQRHKVLELARRLKPGLTLEDVQNPHDFPELDDPDWHYADGVLAGIGSVRSAILALLVRSERGGF